MPRKKNMERDSPENEVCMKSREKIDYLNEQKLDEAFDHVFKNSRYAAKAISEKYRQSLE